MRDLIWLLI